MKLTYKRALESQVTLMELSKLKLPIKASLGIARLSNLVDSEMQIFAKTRDKLVKDYSILPTHTDDENILSFSSSVEGGNEEETRSLKEKTLREFIAKFQELLDTETPDWDIKIPIPSDCIFSPKLLKPLADFIEVV